MSEVYLSYDRADEEAVSRLARALEARGLSVWWAGGVEDGVHARERLVAEREAAGCVVVVWSRASTAPEHGAVLEDALAARRRGRVVCVVIDDAAPPEAFAMPGPMNLAAWLGSGDASTFKRLHTAVRSTLKGPGSAGWPFTLHKRAIWGFTLTGLCAAVVGGTMTSGLDLLKQPELVCTVAVWQPRVSDICGAFGLGNRPTAAERLAWEARPPGDCAALRAHVARFPEGAFRQQAADLLTARRLKPVEEWTPGQRRLALFVAEGAGTQGSEPAAREAAWERARASAERLCKGFAATTSFRFVSSEPVAQAWSCRPVAVGVACGLEGEAVCAVEERHVREEESCG